MQDQLTPNVTHALPIAKGGSMKHFLAALLFLLLSTGLQAAAPQSGLWWSPSESGRGYSLDVQGDIVVVTVFAYDENGRMQWYYSDGRLQSGGSRWTGTLLKFDFGQPLNGSYSGSPANIGNDGVLTIDFTSRTKGTLTLPAGRRVAIERMNFGVGTAPQSLLGEWIYVYTIISDFVDRYSYTTILRPTSTGSGVVASSSGRAAAEYQVSGPFAGLVAAFEFSSTGTVLSSFLFTQYLEEGRGAYIGQSGSQYGMNAYRIKNASGVVKSTSADASDVLLRDEEALQDHARRAQRAKGLTLDQLSEADPDLGQLAASVWRLLSGAEK